MKSKIFVVCIIICHSALSLFAQNKNDRFHTFGSADRGQVTGYIGPMVALSNVEGSFAFDAGATGGVVINNTFFIGLYGQKLLKKVPRNDLATIGYPNYTDGEINMIQAGGVLGYIHKNNNVLNWGFSSSAGIGRLELIAKSPANNYMEILNNDLVIILIPKLLMEVNMTSRFKINVSGGYRFFGMMNDVYTNPSGETIHSFIQSDYTKPEFSISLLFGAFGFRSSLLD